MTVSTNVTPMVAEATRMFSEAREASAVVARQRSANADPIAVLADHLRKRPPPLVLTCARGSSDHAANFAKYVIEAQLGIVTSSQSPSIASVYGSILNCRDALSIAISQSGRSPDLLATMEMFKSGGALTAALVNVEDSPAAQMADVLLPLAAGPETSIAATKSYIAALAAIVDLVAAWKKDAALSAALDEAPGLLGQAWDADWTPLVEHLSSVRGLYVIGRGYSLAIAREAALKFKETCGLHAEAFSAAEVRHGPMALVGPDFPLLVFRQSDETSSSIDDLVKQVADRGGKIFVAGHTADGAITLPSIKAHPVIEPMLQIQSFYRAVNALSLARGFNPDMPPHLAKVTETV